MRSRLLTWWLGCACIVGVAACGRPQRTFDGARAFRHLKAQVALGPRVAGTEAHRRALQYFQSHLAATADRVTVQAFQADCALDSTRGDYQNVVAVFQPESRRRILIGAHWDSRPYADHDPDPAKRHTPVPGANDGASGVAVLLELATALHAHPPKIGVDLVLFDDEDCGVENDPRTYSTGAQQFVAEHRDYRPGYVVILDMVGRRGTRIAREGNGLSANPRLVEGVWNAARDAGITVLVDSTGPAVMDDHVPFLVAGIPAVDLIDLSDPAWHTTSDLPENCSPESLAQVGRLVLQLVARAESSFPP